MGEPDRKHEGSDGPGEAADFPMCEPAVERVPLRDLSDSSMAIRSTLWVPRLPPAIAEELAAAAGFARG